MWRTSCTFYDIEAIEHCLQSSYRIKITIVRVLNVSLTPLYLMLTCAQCIKFDNNRCCWAVYYSPYDVLGTVSTDVQSWRGPYIEIFPKTHSSKYYSYCRLIAVLMTENLWNSRTHFASALVPATKTNCFFFRNYNGFAFYYTLRNR